MFKKLLVAFFGVALIVGALVGIKVTQFQAMMEAGASMVPPPEVVTSAGAMQAKWENTLASTGTLAPVQGITVTAEVPGKIKRIAFESGTSVNAGDILLELDISSEKSQLDAAQAAGALAKATLARQKELRKNGTVSAAELDTAQAEFDQAAAQVASIRTAISKKTVAAPFAGRLGMREVDLGEVLREGDAITSLQSLDPIHVTFGLPQQRLPLLSLGVAVRVTTDAAPGEVFEGAISAISPEVDASTRSVRLQATIANRGEKLRSGMFANVEVVLPTHSDVLAIPITAVLFAAYGDSVFVIEQSGEGDAAITSVRQQFVRLGAERGDFVSIMDGLTQGEQVVSSGVFKLRSGMSVTIDNTLAPQAELDPNPDDT